MSLNLSEGEQIIFQGHPSWRAILGFYLKGSSIAIVLGMIAKLVGAHDATVFLVVLVVLALTLLVGFIKRWATTYTITSRRLNIKRGIVSREIQETRLERVQNVNYRQSVYQRLMQIGDVDFDTAASATTTTSSSTASPTRAMWSTGSTRRPARTRPAATGSASRRRPGLRLGTGDPPSRRVPAMRRRTSVTSSGAWAICQCVKRRTRKPAAVWVWSRLAARACWAGVRW